MVFSIVAARIIILASTVGAFSLAATAQQASKSHVAGGEHLFKQDCSVCHSTEAGKKLVGPSLHGILRGSAPIMTVPEVRTRILNGKGAMPPFQSQLNDQDVTDLIAYLKTQ